MSVAVGVIACGSGKASTVDRVLNHCPGHNDTRPPKASQWAISTVTVSASKTFLVGAAEVRPVWSMFIVTGDQRAPST